MHTLVTRVSLIAGILFCLPSIANDDAPMLRMLNWSDFISPEVVAIWEQRTGIILQQIHVDSDDLIDEILSDPNLSDIDLAVISSDASSTFHKKSLLPLSATHIPNLSQVNPHLQQQCMEYGVPYLWGMLGIVYRSDKINFTPDSWRYLLQPDSTLTGHIGMLADQMDTLTPPLRLNNAAVSTADQAALKQAFNTLKAQLPHVLTYDYAISYLQANPNDNALYLALAYSGDQTTLNKIAGTANHWQFVFPKEGSSLWVDCLVVPERSKQRAIALKFISFLSEPDISALNAQYTTSLTPIKTASRLMPPERQQPYRLMEAGKLHQLGEFYKHISTQTRSLRDRIVAALVSLHESP